MEARDLFRATDFDPILGHISGIRIPHFNQILAISPVCRSKKAIFLGGYLDPRNSDIIEFRMLEDLSNLHELFI